MEKLYTTIAREEVTKEVMEHYKNLDIHSVPEYMVKLVSHKIKINDVSNITTNNVIAEQTKIYGKCRDFKIGLDVERNVCKTCWTYKNGETLYYNVSRSVFIPKFELPQVITKLTKQKVIQKIAKALDRETYNISLDCKVMQLYKDRKITWDDVLKSHNSSCGI